MSSGSNSGKWIFGFLVGAGVGFAAAMLLDPRKRAKLGDLLIEGTCEVADRLATLGQSPDLCRERREQRVGRTLDRKMDQVRAAGL